MAYVDMKTIFQGCCHKCGKKKYSIVRDAGAITIHGGICPFCKKKTMIIPARDWAYMAGETDELD